MSAGEKGSFLMAILTSLPAIAEKAILLPECLMLMLLWSLEWPPAPWGSLRGNYPKSGGKCRASGTSLDHPTLSAAPSFARWMLLGQWWGPNIQDCGREWFFWKLQKWARWGLPLSLRFLGCVQEPLAACHFKDLVPMTRLFQMWLPICRVDWWHLPSFIQGQDILLGLHPEHENFKPVEGGTSTKDYNCLTDACSIWFTNKELVCCHIWVAHSHTLPLDHTRWLMPMGQSLSEVGSIPKMPGQCPWCGPWHLIQVRAFRCGIELFFPSEMNTPMSLEFKIYYYSCLPSGLKDQSPYLNFSPKIFSSPGWPFHSLFLNWLELKFQSFLHSPFILKKEIKLSYASHIPVAVFFSYMLQMLKFSSCTSLPELSQSH